jgi:hypothetical protein
MLARRTRPGDTRGYFVALCSYQRLAPPGPFYLLFTATSDQKAPSYILITSAPLDPMEAACCHSNPPFLPTYHNLIANPLLLLGAASNLQ